MLRAILGGFIVGNFLSLPFIIFISHVTDNNGDTPTWATIIETVVAGLSVGFFTSLFSSKYHGVASVISAMIPTILIFAAVVLKGPSEIYKFQSNDAIGLVSMALFYVLPSLLASWGGKKEKLKIVILEKIATFLTFPTYMGLVFFHLFTVYISFTQIGFIAASVAFTIPILPELYWSVRTIHESDQFINNYTGWLLPIIFGGICSFIAIRILIKQEKAL